MKLNDAILSRYAECLISTAAEAERILKDCPDEDIVSLEVSLHFSNGKYTFAFAISDDVIAAERYITEFDRQLELGNNIAKEKTEIIALLSALKKIVKDSKHEDI